MHLQNQILIVRAYTTIANPAMTAVDISHQFVSLEIKSEAM